MPCAILLAVSAACVGAQSPTPHEHTPASAVRVADSGSDETTRFLARARAATDRYRDRRVAISDGYRRMGPDFPFGGEHWVSPSLVVRGRLDAEHPQALLYVDSSGTTILVGVAYAIPLEPGAPPPDFPAAPAAWHDHWNTILEESVQPHAGTMHDRAPPGPRLTMLHAWIHGENPDGMFAIENRALPFRRLGLRAPGHFTLEAARGLSLATGGDVLYAQMLDQAAGAGAGSASHAEAMLARAREGARDVVAGIRPGETPGDAALDRLAGIWRELARRVGSELGPHAAAALP